MEKIRYQCIINDVDERLDKVLLKILRDKSRNFIQDIIFKKEVFVNNKVRKQSYKLKEGDVIELTLENPVPLLLTKENVELDILYEDEVIIIINKPQGMVVHPAPGNYDKTVVNAILNHCGDSLSGINGIMRPGIVHRIDKNTSGVIVIAKNDLAHINLSRQFKEHSIKRKYIALVEGVMKSTEGIIDKPIGRNKKIRTQMTICEDGKHAVTHFKVIKTYNNHSLIECTLMTGRTHQIRVHLNSIGHPVVGDTIYGFKKQKFNLNGQMLHAKTLGFYHPKNGKYIEFTTDLPEYFKNLIEVLDKK